MDLPLPLLTFLICGLWASKVFSESGRPRRAGLALGLGLHVVGLLIATVIPFARPGPLRLTKQGWLLWVLIALVGGWLTWVGGQFWGQPNLDVVFLYVLIAAGLVDAWTKSERITNLPLAFWGLAGLGALAANLVCGVRMADAGAYLGAWLWVVGGVLPAWARRSDEAEMARLRARSHGRRIRVGAYALDISDLLGRYPIRGPLALLALALLLFGCLYVMYTHLMRADESVYVFMVYALMAGMAFILFLFLLGLASLVWGLVTVGWTLLHPSANRCPRCQAEHTEAERQAEPLPSGHVHLRCPACGKEWEQARFRW